MNHKTIFNKSIKNSIKIKKKILADLKISAEITNISNQLVKVFKNGGKVLLCGNGGSAADTQHLSAELTGKFYLDRDPLFAEALHVNTSEITAIANDYSYEEIFSRIVQAKGKAGDILMAFSTSGKSKNVLKALKTALKLKLITVGFTGTQGKEMNNLCNYLIKIPSQDTPRIQEAHILIGHIICEIVEKTIYDK